MARGATLQTWQLGKRVGEYQLVRFIGAGGMGEVYEALHTTLGTRRAIKFLRGNQLGRSIHLARFEQEARIAGSLDSRHIVKVHEFCASESEPPYMVMDLAQGRSLADILSEQGPLEVERALGLTRQACLGLSIAHERRVVHRDLKPDNLYVCPQADGTELLKILDFGIAKHLGAETTAFTTETGSNLGTAHYMSPEQAQGTRAAIDYRTDIYSLGVILYELLSGRKPYDGDCYNEILIRIVTQRPTPLDVIRPNLPRDLIELVNRSMQREPSARFPSVDVLGAAIARLLGSADHSTYDTPELRPATRPRSQELSTLPGEPRLAERAEGGGLLPAWRRPPFSAQRPWLQLGLVMLATTVVATSVLCWGRPTSRARPLAIRTESPRSLSVAAPGVSEVACRLESSVQTAASTAPNELTASVYPHRLGRIDQPNDVSSTRSRHAVTRAARTTRAVRAGPAIDEPLPANPHALGISPVMP